MVTLGLLLWQEMQNITGVFLGGLGKLLLALVHGFLSITGQIYPQHDRKEPGSPYGLLTGKRKVFPSRFSILLWPQHNSVTTLCCKQFPTQIMTDKGRTCYYRIVEQ